MEARTRTAFHEAGHTVIAWLHGNPVRSQGVVVHVGRDGVSANPTERGRTDLRAQAARVLVEREWSEPARRESLRWRVEADLIMLLAGRVAETIHMGFGPGRPIDNDLTQGYWGDRHEALPLAEEFLRVSLGRVPSISDVLAWYEGPLTDRTWDLLKRPDVWAAVTRVAVALAEAGHLSGDDVERLMTEAPPTRVRRSWES